MSTSARDRDATDEHPLQEGRPVRVRGEAPGSIGEVCGDSLKARALIACLSITARYHGVAAPLDQIQRDLGPIPANFGSAMLLAVADRYGMRASFRRMRVKDLRKLELALPAILLLRDGAAAVLLNVENTSQGLRFTVVDPRTGEDRKLTLDAARLGDVVSGEVVLVARKHRLRDEEQPFSLRLIAGMLLKNPGVTRDIALSAIFMSALALSPILFWRILIDRVLYYNSMNTFYLLITVMAGLIAFETLFGYLRRFLVLYVTRDVDVALSTIIFDRMLNLPIDYFEKRQTGEIARDTTEVWKIRKFLTGELFGTLLDATVILIILPVMFFFSALLTWFALGICGLIVTWLLIMLPVHRVKAGAVFHADGARTSFLVETLHGIRTIKSMALEGRRRREWDTLSADVAEKRYDEGRTANIIQTYMLPLERMMTAGVFALAVYLAMNDPTTFSVGSLLAFMMFTMRLASPLSRLAALLPEFDEAQHAVTVIARMVNAPAEPGRSRGRLRAPIAGRIEFCDVRFRYPGSSSPALDGVSFEIPEGGVFGVMGRSGSGKTTLTRLLQMLHTDYEGQIKIDGVDTRAMDLDHLRSNIGVVLQENFLFRGAVRDTICASKPEATMEEIIEAARLAGAEEFIDRLPQSYDTWIEEGSTNLSGGQRQRLAIARALLTRPRILILDEATSALDAESEAIVNANLARIAEGRTMLIISHRLSSLVNADAILVLERGRVSDVGPHERLLQENEIYSWLWHQQHRHLISRIA